MLASADDICHRDATSDPAEQDTWACRVTAAIASGSREALGQLYEAKFAFLFGIARERTRRDESFALDCVQDVMIRVAASLGRLDNMASLDAWLRRVVLTAALDRLRSERARVDRNRAYGAPDEVADRSHTLDLERELASLDRDDHSLLWLRFARGLTVQQVARHLGLAPKAIDSRIRRLVQRLRARFRIDRQIDSTRFKVVGPPEPSGKLPGEPPS